ncbi:hypothetical protein HOF78_03270 [Candidatus Woesearchaeota archaeon]|jgi:DNA repair protein SbcC/Rad50|nr:hypothetical protein [Candidatus Woesearchaeota archaeon]
MLIKKIKLNNIRSYKDQEVIFPEGSILLSGNIGSGKSTILLAMDFALFGISRDLPGTALLRNGEKEGSVELEFEVNDQNFSIKRGLKRGPTSVTQDTGHLIINGELTEMTAMELKQKIIETLNYPQELLTKSKSMIYHYTVYSPQEKMKEILLNKKEDRLGILRKVFGIDKYQRVRKNTEIFITSLKQKSKEIAVKIADLEQKSEELAERKERQSEITINIEGLNPQIIKFEELIKEKKVLTTSLEEQLKEILNSKHEAEKKRISLEHKKTDINQTTLELQRTNQEIELLEKELSELPIFDPSLQEKLNIIKQDLIKYEEQTIHLEKKKSELETKKSSHQKLSDDINQMDHCPVCDQNVDENHKHSVSAKESKEIGRLDEELRAIKKGLVDNQSYLEEKTKEKAKIEQDIQKQSIVHLKQKDFENKKLSLSNFSQKVQNTKLEISKISQEIIEIEEKTKDNPHLEEKIKSQRTELENLSQNMKELEIKKASLTSERNTISSLIIKIEEEIKSKITAKENITKLMQLKEWLEKQFTNMTLLMEKSIMLRVHSELEGLIQKWFAMLVDAETVKIRIDEEFTPIIEQNGHEIEYIHLSGGEKTAAALSYRLALNQVINTLMSTINTRDILMLDEPTDGFSQEQLSRMRNILEDLNTKQTIIVSHDPMVESFVDRVIRLEKTEHSTKITG